jgi:superfamily II DNA or RNA helicase
MKKKSKKRRVTQASQYIENKRKETVSEKDLERLEFHRHAMAFMPEPVDKTPGVVFFVDGDEFTHVQRFCTCSASKRRTCKHILAFTRLYKTFKKAIESKRRDEDFRSSIWHKFAVIIAEGSRETPESVSMQLVGSNNRRIVKVFSSRDQEMLSYFSSGPDCFRFVERCGKTAGRDTDLGRGAVIERLALLTFTQNERFMLERGFKSRRQVLEESFWYRFAYHCYREFEADRCTLHPAIDEASGAFSVTCCDYEENTVFRMIIPRSRVKSLLSTFEKALPNQHNMSIHPVPLKSIFKVSMNTKLDLEVRPLIRLIQEDGEARFFKREDLERFQYGNLVYIKELGILAELEPPGKMERKFKAPVSMVLKESQIPSFLDEFEEELKDGTHIVDGENKALRIIKEFDIVEFCPEAIDRDWCWLSVKYGFGNGSLSLADILHAKKEGQRFIGTPDGWVDCLSPALNCLDSIISESSSQNHDRDPESIRLSRMDLLRLAASADEVPNVTGNSKTVDVIKRMLAFRPAGPIPCLKKMRSPLRAYQERGVEWIRFLFENGFGGLLCDDMGLGKTHQTMAFMLGLREYEKVKGPFLVVCPTTVLSHWRDKIRKYVPSLKVEVFYGVERDLDDAVHKSHVLLTSYGILRRDIDRLKDIFFSLAVFDEIQNVKNPETLSYDAAIQVKAGMKLGLTGTPIENSLSELKALLDLTVPGYLGTDEEFETRFMTPIQQNTHSPRKNELSRVISPFTLRRLKKTVLDELPDKIEDIRTCRLSEDQVKFYRDAIESRGKGLLRGLREHNKPVPYMHIFALLSLLKQICNHPALVNGNDENYEQYQSGKWDLFREIMTEAIGSGQKVVVYSQFLGMIKIMESFLKQVGVGFVTLTGASRNRGDIISRFNDDPDCRVYVGSLKAGGTGVDLVAGSVVIHYDRWWNAAKEDQATDRVHRIGQKKGVQVFKLVTEGTLEEKISAIIEKKRDLMDSIVKEDDPGLLKTFTREQLIELLADPS